MSLIKINDTLYMTFNEKFTDTKELIKDIPKKLKIIHDIEIFRIKLYGNKLYKNTDLLITELQKFESKIFKSIYKLGPKNKININGDSYQIINIIHSKIFSLYQPHIPIIQLDKTIISNNIIMLKDKILGVKNDSETIIPLYFLLNCCINFLNNSGFFFFHNEIEYNVCEVMDENKKVDYYLILKNKFKIKNINSFTYIFNVGDIIFSINNTHFNFNGHLYSDKYKMYLTLNTYILLHNITELDISYTPNKKNLKFNEDDFTTLNIKIIKIKLDRFDVTRLKIPNVENKSIKYNFITFNLLTEKLYKSLENRINEEIHNKYSEDKIIIAEIDSILYRVVKISNKNIKNLDDVNLILYKKNTSMTKRTIILKNLENGESKKIIL